MGKFACVIHPLNLDLLATAFEKGIREKRQELMKKIMEWIPIFKGSDITGLKSITGKEVEGNLISYTLLPEQILDLDSKFILGRLIEAGKLAEKLGAKIFGLAAYTAHVGRKGVLVAKSLSIPVTTGTSYTIVVAINSIKKAADLVGMDLKDAKVAIVGATGSIGSICAQLLAKDINHLVLIARHLPKLEAIVSKIKHRKDIDVTCTDNIKEGIKDADVIITATNTPKSLFSIVDIQPGSIVLDISLPRNVTKENAKDRKDVLVIDGGIVKPPGKVNFNFYFGLPPGLCYACMAETMILALEDRHESYSLGGDISLEKINDIWQLADKHGFKLAKLRGFEKDITEEQIASVRNSYLKRIKETSKR